MYIIQYDSETKVYSKDSLLALMLTSIIKKIEHIHLKLLDT